MKNVIAYLLGFTAAVVVWFAMFASVKEAAQCPGTEAVEAGTLEMLVQELKLDRSQKSVVNSTLEEARESAKPMEAELRQVREELIRALAEGRTGDEIHELNARQSAAYARILAVQSNALARIFALLDAGQKVRAQSILDRLGNPDESGSQRKPRQFPAAKQKEHVV